MKKNGRRRGVQRYRCRACGESFQSQRRGLVEPANLWHAYTFRRQTVADLATVADLSPRQVRRRLSNAPGPTLTSGRPTGEPVVLVIDTTYFVTYGVMVFRCWRRRRNLLWYFVGEETNAVYLKGIHELTSQGYTIAAVVCDGKKWLCAMVSALGYPVQHCTFHLMKTVTRHLTRHPELPAGRELRWLTLTLPRTTEARFRAELTAWHERWGSFLREKTVDPLTEQWHYTHRRTRAAYFAIECTLPHLFTYERYPELGIPTTTNTLDGTFSHLKQKIRVHRGLNISSEQKMISTILAVPSPTPAATQNVH